jgi:hypothetical protein
MVLVDLTEIDITPYQSTPMLTAEATVTLGADLFAGLPDGAPEGVEKAAKRMFNTVNEMQEVFVTRVELAGIAVRRLMLFDTATDRFWAATRQHLFYWMNYAHEGLDALDDEEQGKIALDVKRQKAELARELDKHLFGIDGLRFLSKPFNQQVTLMASRLTFVAASSKFIGYQELIGPDLLETLNVLQGRYEALVRERSGREDEIAGLKLLRYKLQRHIALYASAVLGMLDEEKPETVEIVRTALRPMVTARFDKSGTSEKTDDTSKPETEGEPLPPDLLEGAPEQAAENDENA